MKQETALPQDHLPDEIHSLREEVAALRQKQARLEHTIARLTWDVADGVCAEQFARQEKLEIENLKTNAELKKIMIKLEDEIEERTVLNEMLMKKNEQLEEFSRKVSHELKNNLLIIKRLMEMGEEQPDFLRQNTRKIAENSARLIKFVDRTLELARSGRAIGDKQALFLHRMVVEIFERVKPENVDGMLMIQKFPVIRGDPHGMEEVFSNLISNSFEHRDSGEEKVIIWLDFSEKEGEIEILYRDNGRGIPEKDIVKIFDATFTTKNKGGFGFGLSIVKKIVEAHGGTIKAQGAGKDRGLEFTITLPHMK